ncbi:MAG: hypothetical protein CMN77_16895 [Spirochaetaceae bacterium]|nr:hypothetical protein [Spirochaetaceae bacterium]|tara:strand:- start:3405 stop:4580 length:1176 start_codon:yes stop_codon:yes gene_type:complete
MLRESRFTLSGLASLVRFGKGGKAIRSTSEGLEARTNDDSALERFRGADPALPQDLVPLGYADNRYANRVNPATGAKLIRTNQAGSSIEETGIAVDDDGNVTIPGNLFVEGTQTQIDTSTLQVEDKNIELAKNATSDAEADGGGIDLIGNVKKWIRWMLSRDAWVFSENIDLESGKEFRIDGVELFATRSTDDLQEGSTNKYFTDGIADTWLNNRSSDDIPEGSTNLFFTDTNATNWFAARTTDELAEGSINLYFNKYRVNGIFLVVDMIGHGFSKNDILAKDPVTEAFVLADCTDPLRTLPAGIVAAIVTPDQFVLLTYGWLQGDPGDYSFTGRAYLDGSTPGAISDTEPATETSVILGQIDSNGVFLFRPRIDYGTANDFITEFENGLN